MVGTTRSHFSRGQQAEKEEESAATQPQPLSACARVHGPRSAATTHNLVGLSHSLSRPATHSILMTDNARFGSRCSGRSRRVGSSHPVDASCGSAPRTASTWWNIGSAAPPSAPTSASSIGSMRIGLKWAAVGCHTG